MMTSVEDVIPGFAAHNSGQICIGDLIESVHPPPARPLRLTPPQPRTLPAPLVLADSLLCAARQAREFEGK